MAEDNLDGCELDFSAEPSSTTDAELEALLVPEGEEEDEDDD